MSRPRVFYGAVALAGLSLIWSAYAITDLMKSGPFGLSVALAGDIGWLTVLWAQYRRIGPRFAAPAAGWIIALGVGVLLVIHGVQANSTAQAVAGPFVVLVGKIVWEFALPALRDPAALTPEQQAEINSVIRDSEHAARLHDAHRDRAEREAQAAIERIQQQARITAARDRADFEITLERLEMRAEIDRRSPMLIAPIANTDHDSEQPAITPSTPPLAPNALPTEHTSTSTNTTSIADLARDHVAITTENADAVRAICALRPDEKRESVAAAVRRARRNADGMKGGYG
ncbi:hypothetical protein [Streptomyces californicus]|uniref:hypothetical protein n=1 Tax=Streptomyces californicus TaxID=67351 RepID=UPI0004BEED0F|nr:hypothetical protein [Streptomyces californicus]QRV56641.1 hypothetical protein I6J40_22400 [Streptomyces californicus]